MVIFESPNGDERVLILQRQDDAFTYRRQWRSQTSQALGGDEGIWSALGPDCGIYNALDTGKKEARQRVPWLKDQFH